MEFRANTILFFDRTLKGLKIPKPSHSSLFLIHIDLNIIRHVSSKLSYHWSFRKVRSLVMSVSLHFPRNSNREWLRDKELGIKVIDI